MLIRLGVLGLVATGLSGCGASLSDFSLKDQEWFSGANRVFSKNISIEAPPLTPNKPVAPEDLLSPEGGCSSMPAADAEPAAVAGPVALGHTECDVVRSAGPPSHVELSSDPQGARIAVVTYASGPRAGLYRFTSGRLSSIEALPEPTPPPTARRGRRR
ncbi:MAG: hypothetical protein DCC74_02795 [Proteobacteria bacterium]|nr:MAG: hypothetical protein DCC74_02795 [Pseudomonadota bacterium]